MKNEYVKPRYAAIGAAFTTLSVVLMIMFKAPQWAYWLVFLPIVVFLIVFVHFRNIQNWRELTQRRSVLLLQLMSSALFTKSIGGLAFSALNFVGVIQFFDQSTNEQHEIAYRILYEPEVDLFLIVFASILLLVPLLINRPKQRRIIPPSPSQPTSQIVNVNLIKDLPQSDEQNSLGIDQTNDGSDHNTLAPNQSNYVPLSDVEPLSEEDILLASDYHSYDSDKPPTSEIWVGREDELELARQIDKGTIVVTGIGGQGKSLFTAKVLEDWLESNPKGFWDWRDCREYSERFRVQLESVIERLTCGQIRGYALVGASDEDVVRYFFRLAREAHGIVVFDNVDHYVKIETREFHSTIDIFMKEALRTQSNLLIVFTCRPSVSYPDVRFREISLRGLSSEESIQLFRSMNIKESVASDDQIKEIHRLTEGHPFWLTVISSQLSRKPNAINNLISELKEGTSRDQRATSILRPVWEELNENQQAILRTMSESTRAEDAETFWNFLSPVIKTHNRFERAFRALRSMSLVIDKGREGHGQIYELHPIVRQFVKSEFPKSERKPYIKLLTDACQQYIITLRQHHQQPIILSATPFEYATLSIELELEANNILEAAKTAEIVRDAYLARGLGEEYLRISDEIIDAIDWDQDSLSDEHDFHMFIWELLRTMGDYGKKEKGNRLIDMYERLVPRGTTTFIGWCSAMCEYYWSLRQYEKAIQWGNRGHKLKLDSDLDTSFDTLYYLNLAMRDSGRVQEALTYFTQGKNVKEILEADHKSEDFNPQFFGNIGRCIHLLNDHRTALQLYIRSADLLESKNDATSIGNKGWAALWISLVCIELGEWNHAILFLSRCRNIWRDRAPFKLGLVHEAFEKIPDGYELQPLNKVDDTESDFTNTIKNWLNKM